MDFDDGIIRTHKEVGIIPDINLSAAGVKYHEDTTWRRIPRMERAQANRRNEVLPTESIGRNVFGAVFAKDLPPYLQGDPMFASLTWAYFINKPLLENIREALGDAVPSYISGSGPGLVSMDLSKMSPLSKELLDEITQTLMTGIEELEKQDERDATKPTQSSNDYQLETIYPSLGGKKERHSGSEFAQRKQNAHLEEQRPTKDAEEMLQFRGMVENARKLGMHTTKDIQQYLHTLNRGKRIFGVYPGGWILRLMIENVVNNPEEGQKS